MLAAVWPSVTIHPSSKPLRMCAPGSSHSPAAGEPRALQQLSNSTPTCRQALLLLALLLAQPLCRLLLVLSSGARGQGSCCSDNPLTSRQGPEGWGDAHNTKAAHKQQAGAQSCWSMPRRVMAPCQECMCFVKTTQSSARVRDARLQLLEAELCAVVIAATNGVWERCTAALTCLPASFAGGLAPRPSLPATHSSCPRCGRHQRGCLRPPVSGWPTCRCGAAAAHRLRSRPGRVRCIAGPQTHLRPAQHSATGQVLVNSLRHHTATLER